MIETHFAYQNKQIISDQNKIIKIKIDKEINEKHKKIIKIKLKLKKNE